VEPLVAAQEAVSPLLLCQQVEVRGPCSAVWSLCSKLLFFLFFFGFSQIFSKDERTVYNFFILKSIILTIKKNRSSSVVCRHLEYLCRPVLLLVCICARKDFFLFFNISSKEALLMTSLFLLLSKLPPACRSLPVMNSYGHSIDGILWSSFLKAHNTLSMRVVCTLCYGNL